MRRWQQIGLFNWLLQWRPFSAPEPHSVGISLEAPEEAGVQWVSVFIFWNIEFIHRLLHHGIITQLHGLNDFECARIFFIAAALMFDPSCRQLNVGNSILVITRKSNSTQIDTKQY
jgi:hypothetical protein